MKGKTIVLGITGSVAAVKAFELCRLLRKKGAEVQVVMSEAALKLVGEQAMEWASGNKVITSLSGATEHVQLFGAKGKADLLLIAPATANTISKIAMGIDDTPITTFATTAIGSKKPVIIAPAMHEPMYEHPIVKENLAKLEAMQRVRVIRPFIEDEKAKLKDVDEIVLECEKALTKQTLSKKKVIITSGATIEEIDPIRVLTSKSSGKTGREIAREAYRRGADVTLLHNGVVESAIASVEAKSGKEMLDATIRELDKRADFLVCAAAISDFSVKKSNEKIKSEKRFSIEMVPAEKLIEKARKRFPKLKIAGFKAETNKSMKELEKIAKEFLRKNKLQLVVANDVARNEMGSDINEVLIVSEKNNAVVKGEKEKIAKEICNQIEKII